MNLSSSFRFQLSGWFQNCSFLPQYENVVVECHQINPPEVTLSEDLAYASIRIRIGKRVIQESCWKPALWGKLGLLYQVNLVANYEDQNEKVITILQRFLEEQGYNPEWDELVQ